MYLHTYTHTYTNSAELAYLDSPTKESSDSTLWLPALLLLTLGIGGLHRLVLLRHPVL